MKAWNTNFWLRLSLLNLLIVAALGVLMRYKIGFELPILNQKNIQHAHSHFAFAAWITQTLMVFMVAVIVPHIEQATIRRYKQLLWANLATAFGMLISFSIQGYALFSILFSTFSIVVSFYFIFLFWKNLTQTPLEKSWFRAALMFNALSTLGTFYLIYMMATKNLPQNQYLSSIYWYLHFQYNGWFFFACAGLFSHYFQQFHKKSLPKPIFVLFAASCVPAYGLSILWLDLPVVLYAIVVAAALGQVVAWVWWLLFLQKEQFFKSYALFQKLLFCFVAVALTVKLSLQLFSVIPSISQLAFGFRPVVIAYMHLVFLAIITIFLILYGFLFPYLKLNRLSTIGIWTFAVAILLNEIALATQGIAGFSYVLIPFIKQILFGISILMLVGVIILAYSQAQKS